MIPSYLAKLPEETIRAENGTASNELPDENLPYWFHMDLRTGEVRALDSGCLYDLLEKYPDLYENYLAEPEPNRRKTLEDYFIKYLEREKPELLKSVPRKAGSGYNSRNHANDRTGAETKTKRTTTGSGQRMKTK